MVFRRIERRFMQMIDWQLLLLIVLISSYSLVVLSSAGFDAETGVSLPMKKQGYGMITGMLFLIFTVLVNPTFWRRVAPFAYVGVCVLLLLVELKGVMAGGSQRWLDLGAIRFQPSEFTKIAVILMLARIFSSEKVPQEGYTLLTMIPPTLLILFPMAVVYAQPDLGTALGIGLIGGSMLLFAGVRSATLIKLALVGVLAVVPIWNFALKDYQRLRVTNFIHPESDPLGSGYHALQSQIAVGSGALAGKGYMKGTQTQLRFLPEQTTDFIFSVLAEEWGFIGSFVLILLYGLLVLRLLALVGKAGDTFSAFVSFGVASLIFWQVFINIGMVIGVMPVVGITLPLLSYGGSSVVTVMTGIGLVWGMSVKRYVFA